MCRNKHYNLLLLLCLISIKMLSGTGRDSVKIRPSAWNNNKVIFSIGGGFPNYEKADLPLNPASSTYKILNIKGSGPFHAKLEYALGDHWGLGLSANYSNVEFTRLEPNTNIYSTSPYDVVSYKLSFFSLNVRLNYHFIRDKRIDPYVGAGLGYKQFKIKYSTAGPHNFSGTAYVENYALPFGAELTIGMRFFINKYLGAYIEAGASRSLVQGGLCFSIGRN